jgi:hypothetical protein
LGWRVDLYCVRAPDPTLFEKPDRVRMIALSDRLAPRWLERVWRAMRRLPLPDAAGIQVFLWGVWFGTRQISRVRRFRARSGARPRGANRGTS